MKLIHPKREYLFLTINFVWKKKSMRTFPFYFVMLLGFWKAPVMRNCTRVTGRDNRLESTRHHTIYILKYTSHKTEPKKDSCAHKTVKAIRLNVSQNNFRFQDNGGIHSSTNISVKYHSFHFRFNFSGFLSFQF